MKPKTMGGILKTQIILILLVLASCSSHQNLERLTRDYYESYALKDLEGWIKFYDENSIIYDVTTGLVMKSRDSILNLVAPVFNDEIPFYKNIKWKLDDITADGNKVYVKGSISNAMHNGEVLPGWDFISHITFNDSGKIKEQYDFVNYPDLNSPDNSSSGSKSGHRDLVSGLLSTLDRHYQKNLDLLNAIDDVYLQDKYQQGQRTVSEQIMHLINVRYMWLKVIAKDRPEVVDQIDESKSYNKTEIIEHLKSSQKAITEILYESLEESKSYDWPSNETDFVGYLISHESHHRGQIVLSLKQSGHPLPDQVTYGLWNWNE